MRVVLTELLTGFQRFYMVLFLAGKFKKKLDRLVRPYTIHILTIYFFGEVSMTLNQELGLRKGIKVLEHEALLNIYYTATCFRKRATEFFRQYSLTDVQFNVLILLAYQSGPEGGLSQAQLSDMMLVNRANITSLIDRMEKAKLVVRTDAAADRRSNIIKMTARGRKLFIAVEPFYARQVREIMSRLNVKEQKKLISSLEKVRVKLNV